MKKRIIMPITLSFSLFILFSFVLIVAMIYPAFRDTSEESEIIRIESETDIIKNDLESELAELVNEISYLGKDLSYEEDIDQYVLQKYRKDTNAIEGLFIFNEARILVSKSSLDDSYDTKLERDLKEMFFYEDKVWIQLEPNKYAIYTKLDHGEDVYLAAIVRFEILIAELVEESEFKMQLINSFGESIYRTGNIDELNKENQQVIISSLPNGNKNTVHMGEKYYSFAKLDYKMLDLYLLVAGMDQAYRWQIRNFIVRTVLMAILVLTVGFLIAWRLYNKLYRVFVTTSLENNYKENEFIKIDAELKKAIFWIEDVVNHYSELNELKEELIELSKKLPKEGDFKNVKVSKAFKIKKKSI